MFTLPFFTTGDLDLVGLKLIHAKLIGFFSSLRIHLLPGTDSDVAVTVKMNVPNLKMCINNKSMTSIALEDHLLVEFNKFVDLESMVTADKGSEQYTEARSGKVRTAFNILAKIWKKENISLKNKPKIFNFIVKSVLLRRSKTQDTKPSATHF